jgi:hypothetical protein
LLAVGGVGLLFLASFSSCSFGMTEGFLMDFLPAVCGIEILVLASFFPYQFEMAEGFSRAFLPSGVSPRAITEVLGPETYNFLRNDVDKFISTSQHITLVD